MHKCTEEKKAKKFVSKHPSEFDLNFATEFNKVRSITSGKWNSNLSKTFELFRSYTNKFPLFQKYFLVLRFQEKIVLLMLK